MTAPTRFAVGLEEGPDGAVMAHALTLPGCAAAGADAPAALAAFERALSEWLRLLAFFREPVPADDAELEIAVDEWLATHAHVSAGETTACFAADLAAVSEAEVDVALRRLGELRALLLTRVRPLREEGLDGPSAGGWTLRRVLEELARAQWLTLSGLGSTPMGEAPADRTLARLDTALAMVVQRFAHLPPEARGARLEIDGEEWTPRKVLRRLLWIEWTMGRTAVAMLEGAGRTA